VAFDIRQGEILALVGDSGSGKSTIALAIMRLLKYKGGAASGRIDFSGLNLLTCSEAAARRIRGREIAMVPQSPIAALNPCLTIEAQLREAWRAHAPARDMPPLGDVLAQVLLPTGRSFVRSYPPQLSVGQAQRVLIAMAILHGPPLLVADEPTSALDMISQAEIIELFRDLRRKLDMSILFISHDLHSVASLSDRVAVLSDGAIVECGEAQAVFSRPRHPYSRKLLEAVPRIPAGAELNAELG
jgi:ABC-type dipeptide/oligopeptide/nickel transport system ATPase component